MREYIPQFSVTAMSRALKVFRSGVYDRCNRPPSPRQQANVQSLPDIRRIHLENRQAYGAKKTWLALNESGVAYGNL